MTFLKKLLLTFLIKYYLRKINKEVRMEGLKAGWKTTEFWLSILTIVGMIWSAIQGFIPADLVAKVAPIVVMVYGIGRAIVKFTPTAKDDEILAKLEEIFKPKE